MDTSGTSITITGTWHGSVTCSEYRAHMGHEAIGPQPTDAPTVSEADIRAGVIKIAKQAQDYARGTVVNAAITALHRQHTSDGKPARYLPEG